MPALAKEIMQSRSQTQSTRNRSLLISAPSSGSGKTTVTLALLRALKRRNVDIVGFKAGPDFIDPGFHAVACGVPCENLDPWGMQQNRVSSVLGAESPKYSLIEGMMGLFDGAADGTGSAAALARSSGIPVVLVVDAAKQSHSVAALVRGFRDHDNDVSVVGVILNKVGSSRHEAMLREALSSLDMPVLGALPRTDAMEIPERHLGLVQAHENQAIDVFIDAAADLLEKHCELESIADLFETTTSDPKPFARFKPLGSHIAIAKDDAFSFCYPHIINDWHSQSATLSFFSPLADEAPASDATAVYLPGGYPELHCETLASATQFKRGLCEARDRDALIYGECGGYMVLGQGLVDHNGKRHQMTGLLELETSFAERKLHLGYRRVTASAFLPGSELSAHEFHYSRALLERGEPLFKIRDAVGSDLGSAGLKTGNVMGSYMHLIDRLD